MHWKFYSKNYEKTAMVTNSTNITKTNNQLSPQIGKHRKNHDIWRWQSKGWLRTGTHMWRFKLMHWNWKSCPNKLLKMYYCFHQIQLNVAKYDWTKDNPDLNWVELFYLKSESKKVDGSRFIFNDNVLALISSIFVI